MNKDVAMAKLREMEPALKAAGLAEATKNAGRFTENLGALAGEMRKARETIDGDTAAKHRSPIEVVLQALTARR